MHFCIANSSILVSKSFGIQTEFIPCTSLRTLFCIRPYRSGKEFTAVRGQRAPGHPWVLQHCPFGGLYFNSQNSSYHFSLSSNMEFLGKGNHAIANPFLLSHSFLEYLLSWDSHKKLLCTAERDTVLHLIEWETEKLSSGGLVWQMYFGIRFSSIPAKLPEWQIIVLSKCCGGLFSFLLF